MDNMKKARRRHNIAVSKSPELHDIQSNAIKQLEWHIIYKLRETFGQDSGVTYYWVENPLKILKGYAADLEVDLPSEELGKTKTYVGFVWAEYDGSIHMKLEYSEQVSF